MLIGLGIAAAPALALAQGATLAKDPLSIPAIKAPKAATTLMLGATTVGNKLVAAGDRGIVITGGGSLLKNLDKRLREETGLPVSSAEDPLSSVVLGAGKMLDDFDLLRKIAID